MFRNDLQKKLERYVACNEEVTFKAEILEFVVDNENCFERSLAKGHITASCWLLNKEHGKALLLHHAKLDKWFQLGGHCDGDSDTLAVAIKEAQEESGITGIQAVRGDIFDIDVHLIPENKKEKAHFHYDVRYLLHVVSDEKLTQNRESKELRWISKDRNDLPTDNQSVMRMFDKWIRL